MMDVKLALAEYRKEHGRYLRDLEMAAQNYCDERRSMYPDAFWLEYWSFNVHNCTYHLRRLTTAINSLMGV